MDRFLWMIWWLGTIVIVLSWTGHVTPTVGWCGFGLACASTATGVIRRRYWRPPPTDAADQESAKR